MKLSIITINYNNYNGLKKTFDSVTSQVWCEFEWIVIDGGSTDGSKELIEMYQEHFAYWCSEPDKGIYHAMNKGISHAKGDYLSFMNSGDCLHNKNTLLQVFCQGELTDVVYGDVNIIFTNSNYIRYYPHKLTTHYLITHGLCHQATFIKTFLLKGCGYREDLKIVSDWYNFLEWFRQGKTFQHINIVISDFDMTGISNTSIDKVVEERRIVLEEVFGKENHQWVEESILMQHLVESYDCDDMKRAFRIKEYGGKKLKRLFHLLLRILNKTF